MLASLRSAAVFGVEAFPVHVEVDVAFGLPHFSMVGLPDATVRESRDRVRSAIRNSGFEFPHHRITVNLAPADVRKAGSSFDLPIALGLLATSGPLARRSVDDTVIVGELSLDGAINGIRGVLPIAVGARRLGHLQQSSTESDQGHFDYRRSGSLWQVAAHIVIQLKLLYEMSGGCTAGRRGDCKGDIADSSVVVSR